MAFIVVALVALALVAALIYVLGAPDKHQQMSEEEFEAEVKRGSLLGAAFMGVEKVLRPHQIEQVLIQRHKVEKGASVAGDPPTKSTSERDSS
jgi:hypothetical protein